MKTIYLSLLLFLGFFQSTMAQDEELLLEIAEPWRSERLSFPIHFAPSLDYKGIEEVRFAKGWGKKDSEEFWTYAFLWYLDEDPALTEAQLAKDIQAYFDGIMNLVGKGRGLTDIPESTVTFEGKPGVVISHASDNHPGIRYEGQVKTFDAFFTKGMQTLNFTAIYDYCPVSKKYTVLFTFSPQERDHAIWKTLNGIKLAKGCYN